MQTGYSAGKQDDADALYMVDFKGGTDRLTRGGAQ
jgi:hypothetical protein